MTKRMWALIAIGAAALAFPAAGVTKQTGGTLNMIAWEGYLQPDWVKPFEKNTGCTVHPKYAGSSDEMVTLMRSGGGSQYDMVSASGDASLRLIYGKDVQATDPSKVPDFKNFGKAFQSPPNNTVGGKHYGISLQWGPNTLLYNTKLVKPAPTSWSVLYDPKYKGKVTVPDNPIQIADVALQFEGAQNPYAIDQTTLDKAKAKLQQQRGLVRKYWVLATDFENLFKSGDAVVGAGWPLMTQDLKKAGMNVGEVLPKEGVTGWSDSWMISNKTKHPICAYKWMNYATSPKVQSKVADVTGYSPANLKTCEVVGAQRCKELHIRDQRY